MTKQEIKQLVKSGEIFHVTGMGDDGEFEISNEEESDGYDLDINRLLAMIAKS